MKNILIDTDVILDFYFDRKPFSNNASAIFSLIETKKIKGSVTPVIVSNVYYLLRKVGSHNKVIDKLGQLLELVDIISIDKKTILKALQSDFKDFEDGLQNYAAESESKIQAIVTRNFKDFKNSKLSVMSPEAYLKYLKSL